jgi:hypothetical protein
MECDKVGLASSHGSLANLQFRSDCRYEMSERIGDGFICPRLSKCHKLHESGGKGAKQERTLFPHARQDISPL